MCPLSKATPKHQTDLGNGYPAGAGLLVDRGRESPKVVSEVDLECSGMRGSDLSVLNYSRTRAWRAALSLNPPSRAGKRAG